MYGMQFQFVQCLQKQTSSVLKFLTPHFLKYQLKTYLIKLKKGKPSGNKA